MTTFSLTSYRPLLAEIRRRVLVEPSGNVDHNNRAGYVDHNNRVVSIHSVSSAMESPDFAENVFIIDTHNISRDFRVPYGGNNSTAAISGGVVKLKADAHTPMATSDDLDDLDSEEDEEDAEARQADAEARHAERFANFFQPAGWWIDSDFEEEVSKNAVSAGTTVSGGRADASRNNGLRWMRLRGTAKRLYTSLALPFARQMLEALAADG